MSPDSITERLAKLSPAKRTLLEQRLRGKGLKGSAGRSIPRREPQEFAPLSFAQERMWFLNQLEPESPAYNEPRVIRLVGDLVVEALEKSLNHIVARHEALRTTFVLVDGVPMQRIADRRSVEMPLVDLRGHAVQDRDAEAHRVINEAIRAPFDLSRNLMLRALLLRLDTEQHILVLVKHHIASDGWSSGIFWQEVTALYEAYVCDRSVDLRELPVQYADYSAWQREWLRGEVLETQVSYWRRQLDNLSMLQLSTDRPRPAIQSFRGAKETLILPKELSEALKTFSRKEGVTLFMTLLAAFQTLLYRYTGQEDIALGSPIAGRNRGEIEGLIGFFVNTLVLRCDVSGKLTFRELLKRVREVCLDAYSHQDLPFEKLVEELQPQRNLSHQPLFQVLFQLNNGPRPLLKLPGIEVEDMDFERGISKFDLSLSMTDRGEDLDARLEYNTDLFEEGTVVRMLRHFQNLLEGIVADPDQCICGLPILSEAEKHQVLVEWNETKRDYPKDKCVHQLFEEQVKRTPEAVAVAFEDQQLTYRELNSQANQLAHYLKKLGVGAETLVGICVERSLEMIVGLLGVLKAGGAYVPLDPEYPKERLEFMLEDARVGVLLTQQGVFEELPRHRARVICLDRDWSEIEKEREENPGREIIGENLAYVIYTSGSTGKPKGVEIQHRSVVNFLNSMQRHHWLNDKDILLAVTTLSFDIAGLELYLPLTVGARSVIVSREIAADAVELARKVTNTGATVMQATPTTWRMLLDSGWQPTEHLKILCGGEALTRELATPLLKNASSLWNMYGPTETTIWSTAFQVSSGDGVVSLGRPIDNTQVYLLDKYRNPVPIGVSGEMFIGGDGLARGYRNRPDLVQEKFLDNPFSGDPKSLLYRTGDLARYLPDGNIEFLGRIDHQVKIRGFRIELGEIEATLARHPSVREAIVLALEDDPESKQLVGYIVANKVGPPTSNDLRVYLRQTLPEYMTPSRFTFLEALPLTPNGKVDRRALPVPAQLRSEFDGAFSEPRTADEERLARIWAEVLKLDKVGIHDNFFELGGHSLLATQVMARIRGGALSIELPLRRLFECPTIQELAKAISVEHQTPQTRRFPSIAPASRDGDLPLSFAQQRLWFIDQLEPESSVYNVPGAWRLSGPLDLVALQRSVNEIVRRHEVLRTNFVTVDGQPLQRIRPSMALALDLIYLVELVDSEKEAAIKRHVREEFREPFDLVRGPLLRAKLLRLAEDDHVLLLTMHHIVSDGWSVGVLFREISLLYQAFMAGGGSPFEDLSIQYADYAVWQRDWLKGDVLEGQLGYWKMQLENLPITQLPTDRPRPPVQRYRGARARVHFDAALTNRLLDLSRGENATLYMTLLAAFQVLLGRYSGEEDIPVGSPIAGRTRSELERLIGFFANTLVLRGDLSGNPTFREFLHRTRDVALEAYAHQDLPFEKLVEDMHPRRDLNISPLFQVMFVLQNDSREDLKLEGLTASAISVDGETAKFDLLLSLRENKLGLAGTLEYDTDLFESTTIDRILAQFETLLRGIVANPDQRLLQLPLLTDRERRQLLAEWNETTQEYPKHLCVHQLFERQAETRPDEIAIVFEDRQMTYRELDVGSNQLAHFLRNHGVGAESVVGVCLERSPEMILAVLAILKAGGAYLPLDPSYPTERLGLMVERGGASIIVTQKSLVSRIPTGEAVCCCLDNLDQILTEQKQESLSSISSPENAAYVLFTSGSTGVPKGVLMEHRPLVNLLSWQAETFASRAVARTLQFAPLSFDVSFQEIFSALCFGGTLVIIGEAERRDAKALWALLNEKAVERMFLPFIALQQLAEASQDDAVTIESLREIITAGEQLQITQSIADLFARLPDCRLCNQYGPTESHVVTSFALGGDPADWPKLPPIGRPIANNKVYILDCCLQPVPIGVIGELYIGGDNLARGYLDQPELSREKFISNPFIKKPGARLYKTGDLARYHADGNIQFVGRIDDQVKVRGFRIEPGEIETILCRHPEVLECVVSAREDATGGKRLVAHIVVGTAHDLDSRKLRDFLKEKLPEYMIPNAFVFLDSLPLTASGKVDRRALPAPDGSRPDLAEAYLAPRNRTEELLAKIWAEVLKLERIGIHDNFFELGGHSLLATTVASRIRAVFRIELALRELFETPTVAALSNHIEAIRCAGDEHQRAIQEVAEQTEETIL